MTRDQFEAWLDDPARPTLVMGVLNVTPDSFSDGGRFADPDAALAQARAMAAAGADLIDIGGESTRPGAHPVPAAQQINRVRPVIQNIAREFPSLLLSIDTTQAAVAAAAVDAGASLVNDISAGRDDVAMLPLIADLGTPVILMHMLGTPRTMQQNPTYADVVAEVRTFLLDRRQAATEAGISQRRILVDPGIGFGKTGRHNLTLLAALPDLAAAGSPLVVGPSRKSFIEPITGEPLAGGRPLGTVAAIAWSAANQAAIVRVHDVGPAVATVKMIRAIKSAR
jgi:dihydropteroate synthase